MPQDQPGNLTNATVWLFLGRSPDWILGQTLAVGTDQANVIL